MWGGRGAARGRGHSDADRDRDCDCHSGADARAARDERGDPELAASHFNWLVMAAPVNRAMLLGDDAIPSADELDRYAEGGVRAFLAAYG